MAHPSFAMAFETFYPFSLSKINNKVNLVYSFFGLFFQ